jgi:hypothetical protein
LALSTTKTMTKTTRTQSHASNHKGAIVFSEQTVAVLKTY